MQESPRPPFVSLSRPDDDELTLLELADRLLDRGVVLTGEATISVAGVDLIYLGLNVVLTAVENLRRAPPAAARDRSD
jgi:gas vesicle structural protein